MSETDIAFDNIKKGFEFTQKNYRKFFNEMLKIIVLSFAVTFGLIIILALLTVAMIGLFADAAALIIGILVLIVLIFIASIIGESIQSVIYNVMDKWSKKINIGNQTKKNLKPIFLYTLAMIVIYGVLVVIPIVLVSFAIYGSLEYASEGVGAAGIIAGEIGIRIYQMVVGIILAFILQFVLFELIVTRMGVIDSIKKSISIVKKTFVPTIVFDVVTWAISMAVAIVAIVVLLIVLLILGLIAFALYGLIGNAGLWLVITLGILIFIIFILALSALELTVVLPMQYYYWKTVRTLGGKNNKKK